jgi:hypothetical protein
MGLVTRVSGRLRIDGLLENQVRGIVLKKLSGYHAGLDGAFATRVISVSRTRSKCTAPSRSMGWVRLSPG